MPRDERAARATDDASPPVASSQYLRAGAYVDTANRSGLAFENLRGSHMSDGAGAADPMTQLKDALDKLRMAWPGADAKPEEDPKVPVEAASVAARARTKFDGILRWMLAIFGAIGLLIFGTLPFVELERVEFWRAAPPLFIAGFGLAIIIWAATRALEPQDASLGELKQTLARSKKRLKGKKGVGKRLYLFLFPRDRAAFMLDETLQSHEREAHLGPGITTVEQLIDRLGFLEKRVLEAEVGWNGEAPEQASAGGLTPAAAVFPSGSEPWGNSSTSRSAVDELAQAELDALVKRLGELREQLVNLTDAPEELRASIRAEIAAAIAQLAALRAAKSSVEHLQLAGPAAALQRARDYYLGHRELLLNESAVAQLRGTFSVARRWLFFGSLLTLTGGIAYAFAIANPGDAAGTNARVVVTAKSDSEAWNALEECRGDGSGDITGLDALLLTSDDADGLQDGPFTIVTTKAGCEGTMVEFKEGDGTYGVASAARATSEELEEVDESAQALATVTLKSNTASSRMVQSECGFEAAAVANGGFQALLTSSDDADAKHDGPFSVLVAEPECPGLELQVPNGDGEYVVIGG